MLKFVPEDIMGILLQKEDYTILRTFIEREDVLVRSDYLGAEEQQNVQQKLALLYQKSNSFIRELINIPDKIEISGKYLWETLKPIFIEQRVSNAAIQPL